jgi:hypothetical protein
VGCLTFTQGQATAEQCAGRIVELAPRMMAIGACPVPASFPGPDPVQIRAWPSPTLSEADRRALGRLHPSFMGKDRIRYRVVDEYRGDSLSERRTRSSRRPLRRLLLLEEVEQQREPEDAKQKTQIVETRYRT